jgi:NitT/TauT family transport system substrate-binding protein
MIARVLCATLIAMLWGGSALGAQTKVRFTTSSTSMLNLPIYVADVMGYFDEEDITPEIIVFKSGGATALAAILGRNADIYIGAPSTTLSAASRGGDVMAFGAVMTEFALDIVVNPTTAKKLKISPDALIAGRFRALKGMKIGVTGAGSATHQVAQYALRLGGLDAERDATIVFVSSSEDMLAAFRAGRVDAIVGASPGSQQMLLDGAMILAEGAKGVYPDLVGLAHIVLVASKRWLGDSPDRARRVLRAIGRAQSAIHDAQAGTAARDKVHAKYFAQLDKALFDLSWDSVRSAIPKSPRIADDALLRNLSFVNQYSDQKLSVAPERVYTNEYLPAP